MRDDFILTNECWFEVEGYQLDSFKHVNNAVYLNFLETARWKFFKEYNMLNDLETRKLYPVVTDIKIRYLRELRLFDQFCMKSSYWLEENYIVSEQKAVLKDTKVSVIKAKVKMLLVSEERIVHDIPDHLRRIFQSRE